MDLDKAFTRVPRKGNVGMGNEEEHKFLVRSVMSLYEGAKPTFTEESEL